MYPRNALQAASNPKSHVLRQIEYFYHTSTCHDPAHAFTDALPTSIGIQGRVGQRNAPTVLNALYNKFQFWDGRAKTLEEQAALPIVNPSEMANLA